MLSTLLKPALVVTAMLVVFGVVAALKSNTPLPWTVPPKWRPLLAVVLSSVGTGLVSMIKAKWPNIPISQTGIIEVGVTGAGLSSLLNGFVETAKTPGGVPFVVKSVPPPPIEDETKPEGDPDAKP